MRTLLLHSIDALHDPTGVAAEHGPERQSWIQTQRKLHSRFLCWMIGVAVICSLGNAAFGQAANDNFANPQPITGLTATAIGTNAGATLEDGEPTTTAGFPGGRSVWFRWTAPSTGSFTFALAAVFDSQLAVYTGSSVGTLTSMGESDPAGVGGNAVVLAAFSGFTYQIRVTGNNSRTGSFTLNWLPTPPNDNLTNAQPLNCYNGPVSLSATNSGATVESGEVAFSGLPVPAKSVWYQLFVSANTTITVSTAGSNFDTTLSIFTRSSPGISGLVSIAGNNNSAPLVTSLVAFPATASVGVYYIAVGGTTLLDQGSITLSVTSSATQPNPIAGQGYERLVSFSDLRVAGLPNLGAAPQAPLTSASNGFLYGSTSAGGENGFGTVFRMTVGGQLTTLVEFTGVAGNRKGSNPVASLLESNDGNFYGTTSGGGVNNFGTVFRMSPAGNFTTLFEFTGPSGAVKGASPTGTIIQAADGTLYGITSRGGQFNFGTVFRILHNGTFQTLVEFSGGSGPASGARPTALVAADGGGVYGTFYERDPSDGTETGVGGGIFRITSAGTYSEVHSFQDIEGGYAPIGLIRGPGGVLYGVTDPSLKRNNDINAPGINYPSTVFKYTPGGSSVFLKVFDLVTFVDAKLGFDDAGNLYGTASYRIPVSSFIFKITPAESYQELPDFSSVGAGVRGFVRGTDGNLFGTNSTGGFQNAGTVFRVSSTGEFITLLEFSNRGFIDKGQDARAGLVEHPDGFFYGTTFAGGSEGKGVVLKMAGDGTITKLVDFTGQAGQNRGASPAAELLVASDRNLYGTTQYDTSEFSPSLPGTLFKITPQGGFNSLLSFTGSEGAYPGLYASAALIEAGGGLLYGATQSGVAMFRVAKSGQNFESFGILSSPVGALTQDLQGNIYGCSRDGGVSNGGYIYCRTSAGALKTVAELGEIANGAAGLKPASGLIQEATDGKFYGAASQGGLFGFGTIYRVSAAGVVETVVSFMGPDGPRRGANPAAGLKAGADGWYYGTTSSGGIGNLGTLYRLKVNGEFETMLDFAYYSVDGNPVGELCFGSDGNVYGARSDALFRLVLPGPPMIYSFEIASAPNGVATIQGKVNPRGSACSVVVEYGEDATISSPITVSIRSGLTGVKTTQVEKTLSLLGGKKYYYRIRATNGNGNGVTVGPITAFTTPGPPVPLATAASEIGTTQAELNGTVDARYANTTVSFEFAPIGDDSPDLRTAVPAQIGDDTNGPIAVECSVGNLVPGVTYYYRIMATNAAGTVFSGIQSFTTLTIPTATIAEPSGVTSHSVVLNGSVNARGSDASVIFEYGTDAGTFPFSVGATPSTIPGDTRAVSASLSNLTQGAKYFYRIKANNAAGDGFSSVGSFDLTILSGFARVFPSAPPDVDALGSVLVNLKPGVGGWRFAGEQLWRSSGNLVGGLTTGDRRIEFRPVPGYIQPPSETVIVTSGGATFMLDRDYYETLASGSGGLSVTLKPESLAAASVPQAARAQWRLLGDDNTQWRDSDTALTGLLAGTYLVESKPVAGRTTPPISSVQVQDFQTAFPTLTYFLADELTDAAPAPVPFLTVRTDNTQNAYAFVGQIRSNLGSSSGFVVKPRVVATAGHVVFDDGELAGVTGLQWLFQRQSGSYEPRPQIPRGFYLFDGYSAARRQPDVIPGVGTTTSKNLDVAALYFVANATTNDLNFPGRGGFGGFLASDASVNEFLTSPAQKILVGYPVNGISANDQGQMHATAPLVGNPLHTVSFTQTFDRTYATPDIHGSGGMSGGPLCVQLTNGNYYPAAVYLGGTGQTIVRSIDSAVVDMFNKAESSGNDDSNNTGGGITLASFTSFGSATQPGALEVIIQPAAAVTAGAGWRLKPETTYRKSEIRKSGLSAGNYQLQLSTVSGFQVPTQSTVTVTGGQLQQITFTYAGLPPAITSASSATGRRGQPLTYQIVADQSPTSYSISGNLPNGIALNTGDGIISGTLQQAGVFTITLRATNAGGTGTKSLSLICRPAVSNQSATATLGQPLSRKINSSESGADVSYSADDLPPGTSLKEDGLIDGSPTQAGVFPSLVTVTKDGAYASAILTFTVTATPLELWRMANFQTTSNTGNASNTADPDKDGQTNLSEYAAGTDPNNLADVFNILTTLKTATTFTVTAAGKASRSYVLERRSTLATGPWTTVTSIGPLAGSAPLILTDPSPPAGAAFYRLRVSAP